MHEPSKPRPLDEGVFFQFGKWNGKVLPRAGQVNEFHIHDLEPFFFRKLDNVFACGKCFW